MSDRIERLADIPPGPSLAVALAGVDVTALPAHDLIIVAAARQRQQAYDDAQQLRLYAELVSRPEYHRCSYPTDGEVHHEHRAVEVAGDELSLALSWTPSRATRQIVLATELVHELPDTLAALTDGMIDADKARLIADRTRCLTSVEQRQRVEQAVLPTAAKRTRGVLDGQLRREIIAVDPAAAEQRRRESGKRRRVGRPEPASPGGEDGMAIMPLYGPAEDLTAFWIAIDAAARRARSGGDERTLDQLRFDLLTGLGWTALELGHLGCCNPACLGNLADHADTAADDADTAATSGVPAGAAARTSGAAPAGGDADPGPGQDPPDPGPDPSSRAGRVLRLGKRRGKAATVAATVPFTSLAGINDEPGWLDGYGPITAAASRRITTDGTLRRMLTDPADGHLLDYGRTVYTPPAGLAEFVVARDRTCRFPTCNRPASEAEIDHKIAWTAGGSTDEANLWALHDGHHFAKTSHGFTIHTDQNGTTWWTTPAGHTYPADPETIGPVLQSPRITGPGHTGPDPEPAPF